MNRSTSNRQLEKYISKQLDSLFPDTNNGSPLELHHIDSALKRAKYCFSRVNNKYFSHFNHLHTDQYAMFLYLLSNTIWRTDKNTNLASRVYALNKALHGIDVFYEVELPDIFLFVHPVGTVLGRASYGNYFVTYQRVTVGGSYDCIYPTLGSGVVIYGGSAIIGDCGIGDNVLVSVNTTVMDTDVPNNSVVNAAGCHPTNKNVMKRYFVDLPNKAL
jgi:serine O-acetyltransferase